MKWKEQVYNLISVDQNLVTWAGIWIISFGDTESLLQSVKTKVEIWFFNIHPVMKLVFIVKILLEMYTTGDKCPVVQITALLGHQDFKWKNKKRKRKWEFLIQQRMQASVRPTSVQRVNLCLMVTCLLMLPKLPQLFSAPITHRVPLKMFWQC